MPPETQWSVTLNGTTKSSNTSQITFNVVPGNYSYKVTLLHNYNSSNMNGVIFVTHPVLISIAVTPSQTISPTPNSSGYKLQIIFIPTVIIIIIWISIVFIKRSSKLKWINLYENFIKVNYFYYNEQYKIHKISIENR